MAHNITFIKTVWTHDDQEESEFLTLTYTTVIGFAPPIGMEFVDGELFPIKIESLTYHTKDDCFVARTEDLKPGKFGDYGFEAPTPLREAIEILERMGWNERAFTEERLVEIEEKLTIQAMSDSSKKGTKKWWQT